MVVGSNIGNVALDQSVRKGHDVIFWCKVGDVPPTPVASPRNPGTPPAGVSLFAPSSLRPPPEWAPGWYQPRVSREGWRSHEVRPLLQSISFVARQVDKLQHRAVRIVKIGARTVEHAALPVLFKRDLDPMSAQMVERCFVLVMCDDEGVMHAAMVVEHG